MGAGVGFNLRLFINMALQSLLEKKGPELKTRATAQRTEGITECKAEEFNSRLSVLLFLIKQLPALLPSWSKASICAGETF